MPRSRIAAAKPGEVADHAAAEGDDRGRALDPGLEQEFEQALELAPCSCWPRRPAGRPGDGEAPAASRLASNARQMRGLGEIVVGHDDQIARAAAPPAPRRRARSRPAPDHDVVAAVAPRSTAHTGGVAHDALSLVVASASSARATTVADRPLAAVDHEIGLGVDRRPLLEQRRQPRARIAAREQRPVVTPRGAPDQHVQIGAQPDRERPLAHQGARLRIDEGAAAERQDLPLAAQQPGDHLALPGAKRGLADLREDVGDGGAGGGLDRRSRHR